MAFDLSALVSLFRNTAQRSSVREGVVGIDIGTSSMKVVQITSVKNVPTLTTYGELQLGPYDGVDVGRSTNLSTQKLTEALKEIIREARTTSTRAHISLAYSASFNGVMMVPTLDTTQISHMLPIEARKYVPTSLSRVSLDWVRIDAHEAKGSTRVFVSAVYNEALGRYREVVQGASLDIAGHEIELFSAMRSGLSKDIPCVALLDMGASSTRLAIVHNGMVKKTHSIPLSTVQLTTHIAEKLESDFATAEEYKRTHGMVSGDAKDDVAKIVARGVRELVMVTKRFEADESIVLDGVVLTGGGSLLPGLIPYLASEWGVPVRCIDPFSKIAYPTFLDSAVGAAGPIFAGAIGSALKIFEGVR